MRLLKDRIKRNVSEFEILCSAYEPRRKIIAIGSFEEPVLLYRYPYMKLFKKIIHRERIPITEEDYLRNPNLNITTNKQGHKYTKGSILTVNKLLFSESGQELLIGYQNGDLLVYNTRTWKKVWEHEFRSRIGTMQCIPQQKQVLIGTEGWNIFIVDTKEWKILEKKTLKDRTDGTMAITKKKDKLFVIRDKKRIAAYDFDTLEELQVYKGHNRGINKILISDDETILASSGNDCKLCLFDIESGELISYLLGHSDEVHAFVFSPDYKYIVSSSEDGSLKLWNLKTYKAIKTMNKIPNAFAMERYGNVILMGNIYGEIRMFKIF